MRTFLASARHEILYTRRSRIALILVVVFVTMVLASAVIGWITTRTVTDVYEQIRADGMTNAPNPFTGASPLYFARNSAIYVVLIGCLMAIILGAAATLRDRQLRTADLVLTRPVSVPARLLGQMVGIGAVIAVALVSSLTLSWLVIGAITSAPLTMGETGRLALFGAASWALMMIFVGAGMLAGLVAKQETAALLVPILVWSGIAFVLPQIGTAARPIALLNPVPSISATGGGFDLLAAITGPLSITEEFKRIGSYLLHDPSASGSVGIAIASVSIALVALIAIVVFSPRPRLRRPLDD